MKPATCLKTIKFEAPFRADCLKDFIVTTMLKNGSNEFLILIVLEPHDAKHDLPSHRHFEIGSHYTDESSD